jgi:hypothetical protein
MYYSGGEEGWRKREEVFSAAWGRNKYPGIGHFRPTIGVYRGEYYKRAKRRGRDCDRETVWKIKREIIK